MVATEVGFDFVPEAEYAAEKVNMVGPEADRAVTGVEAESRSEEEPGLVVVEPCDKVSFGVVAWDSGTSSGPDSRADFVFEAEYMLAPFVGTHGDRSGAPAGPTALQLELVDKVDLVALETFVEDKVGDQEASAEQ